MATYTRPIPTLRGEDAKIFNKKADEALKNRKNAIVFNENEKLNTRFMYFDLIKCISNIL